MPYHKLENLGFKSLAPALYPPFLYWARFQIGSGYHPDPQHSPPTLSVSIKTRGEQLPVPGGVRLPGGWRGSAAPVIGGVRAPRIRVVFPPTTRPVARSVPGHYNRVSMYR
jgi:hypothetical protein